MKHIAIAILEDCNGHFVLQLRDDKPNIIHPNMWSFFGGHVEADETPEAGVYREIGEELSITPTPHKFCFIRAFDQLLPNVTFHVFYYLLDHDELMTAQLTEGQAFRGLTMGEIKVGIADGKVVADTTQHVLQWFWAHHMA